MTQKKRQLSHFLNFYVFLTVELPRCSACSIICAHNHPGGEVMPSQADLHVTKQIVQSGEIVGIPLLDHLIIGRDSWFSFRQHDLL